MEGTTTAERPTARQGLLHIAALVVVVFGLQATRAWLLPICFALLIAVLSEVPLRWLQRRGLPRPLAAVVAFGAVAGAFWLLVRGLLVTVADFGKRLPHYEARLQSLLDGVVAWFGSIGVPIDTRQLVTSIEPRAWLAFALQSVGGAFGFCSALLLVAFAVVFTVWEGERLRDRLRSAFGRAWPEARTGAMVADLQRYLGVKTVTSALTGLFVYGLNLVFGVEFAALWGLLAFVLNYIPILGSIIAAVPAVLLALVVPELGWRMALPLAIGYVIINNGISNLLEPVLMGRQFGLPAFVVFLSLVFWGWVWGVGGMFLAVPLTIVFGTILDGRDDLALLRALIGRGTGR
ncbi:MAG TPA: AI-2E family transporter [Planctomycetota bacterium]|nr:AI-2E family transporter [Planctomycetota bacterium]